MELRFEDQPYQLAAVDAAVRLFDGQPRRDAEQALVFGELGLPAVGNRMDLTDDQVLANLRAVQEAGGLARDGALRCISEVVDTAGGVIAGQFANFSVEMETGTGKTYTYVRTALELARRYGCRKYVIVVPSVAIREGVLKTFSVTARHFAAAFPDVVYRWRTYRSDKLSEVTTFALSSDVEFLIVTIDSFNRAANVMRQGRDELNGVTPIHAVQATRPVLILDEPQNMESQLRVSALAQLHPLFALRYSATHRDPYNNIYRLTPYDAYRLRLVKQIAVASVVAERDANRPYIRLVETRARGTRVRARLALHALTAAGTASDAVCTVRAGDRLADTARRSVYDDYTVERIDVANSAVTFTNGVTIRRGEAVEQDKKAIFDAQIERAIAEHFRTQEALADRGVKVLTLFFIDRVDNYANNGIIRRLFDQHFRRLRDRDPAAVQGAYFARKRRRGGQGEMLDSSVERSRAEDEAAFDLIMRDKERLLSFDEPVSFLFSHSALREGWDNPNVFQIVTLNQSVSDTKKRQEIGRGLRIPVDQTGARVFDANANTLTVIANESYRDYVAQLQRELDDDGERPEDRAPPPIDANLDQSVSVRPDVLLSDEFRHVWACISRRTRYEVRVDTDRVLAAVVPRLDAHPVHPPRIRITTAALRVGDDDAISAVAVDSAVRETVSVERVPDLVELIAHQLRHTTPRMRLTKRTIWRVLAACRQATIAAAILNPQGFAIEAGRVIKDVLAEELVAGIAYHPTGDAYDARMVDPPAGYSGALVPVRHSVTDKVRVDSQAEREFVTSLDARGDVPLFLRLPPTFVIPTPVGDYSPGWAIVVDGHAGRRLLVRETARTADPVHRRKVACATAHFAALGVDFDNGRELPFTEAPQPANVSWNA